MIMPDDTQEQTFLAVNQRFGFGIGLAPREKSDPGSYDDAKQEAFRKPDITRWKRIVSAIERKEGPIREVQRFAEDKKLIRYPESHYHQAFFRRPGNVSQVESQKISEWRIPYHVQEPSKLYEELLDPLELARFIITTKFLLVICLILPAAYGGIHLAAANFDFPSGPESLCWKTASIYTMVALPGMIFVSIIPHFVPGAEIGGYSLPLGWIERLSKTASWIILFGYVIARTYLVVESFVSLRAEPIGAFWTPGWVQMIPHL